MIEIPIENDTYGHELQGCIGLDYSEDGCYLVSVYVLRSKFSPTAGQAHTLLVNSYDANANYSLLSTLHVPLPSGTSLRDLHAEVLFHRGELTYHTVQLMFSSGSYDK